MHKKILNPALHVKCNSFINGGRINSTYGAKDHKGNIDYSVTIFLKFLQKTCKPMYFSSFNFHILPLTTFLHLFYFHQLVKSKHVIFAVIYLHYCVKITKKQ